MGVAVAVGAAVIVLALVAAALLGVRHLRRRGDEWRALAARRGLVFVDGDPLDLADAAHGKVSMTLHGPSGAPRCALVGVWPTGSDLGTVPAVVGWAADLPGPPPAGRRWSMGDHPRHGRLVTLAARTRVRGGGVASAAEAEALFDEFWAAFSR